MKESLIKKIYEYAFKTTNRYCGDGMMCQREKKVIEVSKSDIDCEIESAVELIKIVKHASEETMNNSDPRKWISVDEILKGIVTNKIIRMGDDLGLIEQNTHDTNECLKED